MGKRRPFNPDRVEPAPEEAMLFEAPMILSVSQLTRMVRNILAEHLPETVHVVGQISNFKRHTSGHLYLTLKDASSEIRAVMWRSAASGLKFTPSDGLEVIATGHVDVYEPRGQYQLYIRKLEPRGVGALELAFRQLCEKLRKEGLFDARHKKPLRRYPRRIAVVTSPTGAAIRDIIQTVRRRFPCVELLVLPARVQGEGAAEQIAAAIRMLNAQADRLGGIDVMIVGRGGGSLEDLWAFNEEIVARAIFASRIPIISAVGHEVDVTVADLVADVRAPTPTAAAELAVPVLDDVLADLAARAVRLGRALRAGLELSRSRLRRIEQHVLFRQPELFVRQAEQRLDEAGSRLRLAVSGRLGGLRRALHRCELVLATIRPESVLVRLQRRLERLEHRLRWAQGHCNVVAERSLARRVAALMGASPQRRVDRAVVVVGELRRRLDQAAAQRLASLVRRVEIDAARIEAASPRRVLARGFSITRDKTTRRIVTDPAQVRAGQRISTETAGGVFDSDVVEAP